jgi:hypothetical protein
MIISGISDEEQRCLPIYRMKSTLLLLTDSSIKRCVLIRSSSTSDSNLSVLHRSVMGHSINGLNYARSGSIHKGVNRMPQRCVHRSHCPFPVLDSLAFWHGSMIS